jgi:hypothetical protein
MPFVLVICAVVAGSGCARVQPGQMQNLADYTMREDRDPLSASFKEHIHFTREASTGGKVVGGGGCGCN